MEETKYKRCNDCAGTMSLDTEWCVFCKSKDLSIHSLITHTVTLRLLNKEPKHS